MIYSKWQSWNTLRAQRAFVFSETNFLFNKNYHSLLLSPISFESPMSFYGNMPFLFYSSMLVERYLGWQGLALAYGVNCLASALAKVIYERQIGYKEVRRRGSQMDVGI